MYNFEQIGFLPRSIVRTFQRFLKQIGLKTDLFVIYEFRVSRYIALASLQCFFFLIICPWFFQFLMKFFLFFYLNILFEEKTLTKDIFLNFNQQERAFSQMQTFSQQIYFETLFESFQTSQKDPDFLKKENFHQKNIIDQELFPPSLVFKSSFLQNSFLQKVSTSLVAKSTLIKNQPKTNVAFEEILEAHRIHLKNFSLQKIYQAYFLKSATFYNKQSISILTNWILDFLTLLFFLFLLVFLTPQIVILKTFFIESLFSLSETTKCFFLIFSLDLLVGFHSSKSWEVFLQFFIEHFGFYQNQNFIAFFISTFPVLLDTIFKYWIFRYLNKISPSTVATYQAMIE